MRNNPRDWRIEDINALAKYFGFFMRQPGTSHITYSRGPLRLTIPSHKPIKPIYVKKFIALIDEILQDGDADEY